MLEDIKSHLRKKNKDMSDEEINKQAERIWQAYCDVNLERDEKREEDFKKVWDAALQKGNDQFAMEYLSADELTDYFRGDKKKERPAPEVVAETGVKKKSGYLYFIQCRECSQKKFVSKKCTSPETHYHDIWRDKMSPGSGGPEFVAEGGIHKELGYLYYVDQNGHIARVKIEK
tara:strand:- start:1216 stop:1737 length:522 start_codon:yes stop_codon:yes gene_type:complete